MTATQLEEHAAAEPTDARGGTAWWTAPRFRRPRGGWRAPLRWLRRHPAAWPAVVAAIVRLGAVVFNAIRTDGVVIPDEQQYISLATWIADGHDPAGYALGYGRSLLDSIPAFLRPITVIAALFGDQVRSVGSAYVALFGILTAVLTTWLALRLVERRFAIAAGLVVALMPSQILFSSVLLRESMVWAACATVACAVILANRATGIRRLLVAGAVALGGLLALGWLRDQVLLAAAWGLLPAALLGPALWRGRRLVGAAALALLVPMAASIGPGGLDLLEQLIPRLGTLRTNLSMSADSGFTDATLVAPPTVPPGSDDGTEPETDPVNIARPSTTTTTAPTTIPDGHSLVTGYEGEVYLVDETAAASFAALPRGLVAVLLRPLPWEAASGTDQTVAKLENVLWYVLYLLAALGVALRGWRERATLGYPILLALGLIGSAAVIQGNVGTAFRHRGELLWIVAILAATGAAEIATRRRRRRVHA